MHCSDQHRPRLSHLPGGLSTRYPPTERVLHVDGSSVHISIGIVKITIPSSSSLLHIFPNLQVADYGLVMDIFEAIPDLGKEIQKHAK